MTRTAAIERGHEREFYEAIIISLEIPSRFLPPGTTTTPEWEMLDEIVKHFDVPPAVYRQKDMARALVSHLRASVDFSDFFEFVFSRVEPFAYMLTDILQFLHTQSTTVRSRQTIREIEVAERVDRSFRVQLSHFPIVQRLVQHRRESLDRDASTISSTRNRVSDIFRASPAVLDA